MLSIISPFEEVTLLKSAFVENVSVLENLLLCRSTYFKKVAVL